jgi:hypothetical protein
MDAQKGKKQIARAVNNMKQKHSTIILIGLAVALLLFIAIAERPNKREESQKAQTSALIFNGFKAKDARKIEIAMKGETIVLERASHNAEWKETGEKTYPADSAFINDTVLTFFTEAAKEQVISRNAKKYSLFGVDPESAQHVVVFGDGRQKLAEFFIGKAGTVPGSYFLRNAQVEEVLSLKKDLAFLFGKTRKQWRDLQIFHFDPSSAQKMSVESAQNQLVLEKEKDTWKADVPPKAEIDSPKAEDLVKNFSEMKAQEYVEAPDLKELELTPDVMQFTISVLTKDGTTYSLLVGKYDKDAQVYYAKSAEGEYVYTISESALSAVNKTADALKPEKPAEDVSTKSEAEEETP